MKRILTPLTLIVLVLLAVPACLWAAQEQLIYAVCVVRHGERTPWSSGYTNLHCDWPYKLGELTPQGVHQEFVLGTKYAERYGAKTHLLPAQYLPNSVYVLSSGMNRTVLSAQSLLTGLYAPSKPRLANDEWALPDMQNPAHCLGLQSIPVFTLLAGQKGNLLNKEQEDETLYKKNIAKVLRTRPFKALDETYKADLERWSTMAGSTRPIRNVRDLVGLSDYLFCMLDSKPPFALPEGLSVEEANRIIEAGYTSQAKIFSDPFMMRYMIRDFLRTLCADLQSAATTPRERKLTIYLGHDFTILPIMAALKAPLPSNPPYAAHIEFELYRTETGPCLVRAFYQNASIPIGGKDGCTLSEFTQALSWVQ